MKHIVFAMHTGRVSFYWYSTLRECHFCKHTCLRISSASSQATLRGHSRAKCPRRPHSRHLSVLLCVKIFSWIMVELGYRQDKMSTSGSQIYLLDAASLAALAWVLCLDPEPWPRSSPLGAVAVVAVVEGVVECSHCTVEERRERERRRNFEGKNKSHGFNIHPQPRAVAGRRPLSF